MDTPHPNPTITKDQWLMRAIDALVAAGFNRGPGLLGYAHTLYNATLTPEEAVRAEIARLE